MNYRIPPKPEYFQTVPEGTCRWCNLPVALTPTGKVSKSRWHPICLEEYKRIFWPKVTRNLVWKRDKGKCASCGKISPTKSLTWHMDHIKPLYEANGDITYWYLENIQTLCLKCHREKTSHEATMRAEKRKELKCESVQAPTVSSDIE